MDKFWQVLNDHSKCLICKRQTLHCTIFRQIFKRQRRLSLSTLENHVDNFEQALYDMSKSLIHKEYPCIDQKTGKQQAPPSPVPTPHGQGLSSPGYPAWSWTILWITVNKPCMTTLSG